MGVACQKGVDGVAGAAADLNPKPHPRESFEWKLEKLKMETERFSKLRQKGCVAVVRKS